MNLRFNARPNHAPSAQARCADLITQIELHNKGRNQENYDLSCISARLRDVYQSLGFTGYKPIYWEIAGMSAHETGYYAVAGDYYRKAARKEEEDIRLHHGINPTRLGRLYEHAALNYELVANGALNEQARPRRAAAFYAKAAECYLLASNDAEVEKDEKQSRILLHRALDLWAKLKSARQSIGENLTKAEAELEITLMFTKADLFPLRRPHDSSSMAIANASK